MDNNNICITVKAFYWAEVICDDIVGHSKVKDQDKGDQGRNCCIINGLNGIAILI